MIDLISDWKIRSAETECQTILSLTHMVNDFISRRISLYQIQPSLTSLFGFSGLHRRSSQMTLHVHENLCMVLICFYRDRFCSPAINQISLSQSKGWFPFFLLCRWEKYHWTGLLGLHINYTNMISELYQHMYSYTNRFFTAELKQTLELVSAIFY